MQSSALVSVVMPNRNGARWLDEAIESVVAQSYSRWELIAVDDGSSDESLSKLRAWAARDARIRLVGLGDSGGAGMARNVGIEQARGEFIALLDSDDRMLPHRLEKQLRDFDEVYAQGGLILQTDAYLINEKGQRKGRYMPAAMRGRREIGKNVRIDSAPSTWFFRSDLPVRFHPAWRVSQAGPFMNQILELGKIAYFDEPTVEYRVCLKSASNVYSREILKTFTATSLTMQSTEKWRRPVLPSEVREPPRTTVINWACGRSAKAALLNDRPLLAMGYLAMAFAARPGMTIRKLLQNWGSVGERAV